MTVQEEINALAQLVSTLVHQVQHLIDENVETRKEMREMRQGIKEIREDIAEMRQDIQHLTVRVAAVEQGQKLHNEHLSLIDDHIARNYNHVQLVEQSQLLIEKQLNRLKERMFNVQSPDAPFVKAA